MAIIVTSKTHLHPKYIAAINDEINNTLRLKNELQLCIDEPDCGHEEVVFTLLGQMLINLNKQTYL